MTRRALAQSPLTETQQLTTDSNDPVDPNNSFRCPHGGCTNMITNAGLPKHYKEKHSKDPSSEHVPCGTCDLTLQPTSRIKHIRGTHLRLLDTPCPIGGKIFSRRDAAKRHAKDCDGSCAGDRT